MLVPSMRAGELASSIRDLRLGKQGQGGLHVPFWGLLVLHGNSFLHCLIYFSGY